ncbi:MAG: APH(3') family aminoglycoside O-phosphotransferase [Christensenellales bacterium]|jgi:aminoglycoside 3'-phosphotransferase-3
MISERLRAQLAGWQGVRDTVGRSGSAVYAYTRGEEARYLKLAPEGSEVTREIQMLRYLAGRLPVPEVLYEEHADGQVALLMSAAPGRMACDPVSLAQPVKTARALAQGILAVSRVPVEPDCPPPWAADKLEAGRAQIEEGRVDMDDWDADSPFADPWALWRYLRDNRPEEEGVFTHGDFCLPNVFVQGDRCCGLIDWGRAQPGSVWHDIALCERSLRQNFGPDAPVAAFFEALGMRPDPERMAWYRYLDELF